ncbi:AT-hook motif nuclear-localized protein 14 isoform X1 [Vigna radiata var. radiata]|uniref:AT-hook motif nuclear-localized protein n=1 Tax=Vigna radiata var. radiata TaxID=3916 RepID=A0A1S3TD05_VIGRR|nr:AT-hook motif nuclear-localized protein 14 isoform X1 [Vigna radiata var. radiata]
MEPNDNQLTSFFHHHHPHHHHHHQPQPPPQAAPPTTASPTNGLLPNADASHILYPHSVASAVSSQLEPAKRKRGRPRKYGTPEQALAAKKAATASSQSFSGDKKPHSPTFPSSSSFTSKKSHSFALGNAGQGFTPHVIAVAAGEDVGQKIMLFMQQSRREMCILSASGSISNASLRQPATSGGNITYEGRFEIISLTGSYVRNEIGTRTGGLSVCLSNTDGQIIGGGVGGPLKAAGPVQVIVGTFFIDNKKESSPKVDASASKLPPPPVSEPVSSLGFRQSVDSPSGNPIRGNDEHQAMGGSHFMIQQLGLQGTPPRSTDWARPDSRNSSFELTGFLSAGRTGHGSHQSPENGGYEQIPD